MVLLLIELGADANYHNERWGGGQTILRTVAYAGFTNLVQPLIDAGADVNKMNEDDHAPLMTAAATGRLDMVEALLTNGADVSQINSSGNTALDYGSTELVRQSLIDAGTVCGPGKNISGTMCTTV